MVSFVVGETLSRGKDIVLHGRDGSHCNQRQRKARVRCAVTGKASCLSILLLPSYFSHYTNDGRHKQHPAIQSCKEHF